MPVPQPGLPAMKQYHFERDDFVKTFRQMLSDDEIGRVEMACVERRITENFLFAYAEEEYYVLHLSSGKLINWYKHLGRTNTCSDPDFTLSDLNAFLRWLKKDIS